MGEAVEQGRKEEQNRMAQVQQAAMMRGGLGQQHMKYAFLHQKRVQPKTQSPPRQHEQHSSALVHSRCRGGSDTRRRMLDTRRRISRFVTFVPFTRAHVLTSALQHA